jgi:hypothetical protein
MSEEANMRKAVLMMLALGGCRSHGPGAEAVRPEEQRSEAERVVLQQQDAYNRHDLEAFAAAHAPDVRFYRYPDSLIFEGRDSLRARFGRLFAKAPSLRATTDARMAHGDIVVWQETATGMPGGKPNTAVFVWEVHGGQITRVLLIP